MTHETTAAIEAQIDQWRQYLHRRQAIRSADVAELEDHLRETMSGLVASGLQPDEAFFVAVKRLGDIDSVSKEFAREHSERLWKQLVLVDDQPSRPAARREAMMALGGAVLAAILIKIPALFGADFEHHAAVYVHNISIFVLPVLAAYFLWQRRLGRRAVLWATAGFSLGAIFANIYPFVSGGSTEILTALHLPIALWAVVGYTYAGRRWREVAGRMDFIRYTGELFIYYALIAFGGGVLTGFTVMIFNSIGVTIETALVNWIIPCGAAGAVIIGSWLVEAKQSVIENMAPVLTRLFTPLFAVALVAFLVTALWTGRGIDVARDVLISFDLLLVVVLGLVVYTVSARAPAAKPGFGDVLQIILLVSALLADAVALWAIAARISEFGFSPNRVAALGENIILLINLVWTTVLYIRFWRGRTTFVVVEGWQTKYLPVITAWAALVVIVFPPLFSFR